ncbi:AI-2E family transporter [Aggregatibacter aphrophilus]|jgi:perM|uniref:Pheromone autoinducer 2 transporter n=1 Tax=Aggregatibacter aphrophilus ATCC 33389 TaxID=985008 RepID=A0A448F8Y2_AGGAP|nr:AI-2E family transporter [Aggregatibacter aphrophilus]KNE84892.1 permase [Aggregatibacter aphrophilus ATCC 33389]OBY54694.1 AI-2E family transporter [Aggregatibacter aphrophilus]RDE86014.1 AI-2E family transporter [Aggregatibacter aphrophilus]RDE91911.1 AI-2E family transporter [Aggregatibacter aphrophilus]SQI93464.1 pheromone autoinducer 2 transporter [Aggregatibacter aphrophilus]
MIEMLKNWYNRRFSDPQAMGLAAILLFGFIAIYFFSDLIAPLLVAIVLAYLLEWPVRLLNEKLKCPRLLATTLVIGTFTGLVFLVVLVLLPNLWTQMVNLLSDLPHMFNKFNEWLLSLPERYPDLIDTKTVESIFGSVKEKILGLGESALKLSLASLMNLVTLGIYAFLVPLMVFFLLKDKRQLMDGVSRFLPRNRTLASAVWVEMQQQISNYIRGKLVEIFVVAAVTYMIFLIFGLNYPLLLAVAVGISVLVPYIGAVLVAIPVVLVAIFQFGDTHTFWYIVIAFVVSQLLDGNLLVPFLFSEAVNLHPLVIIIAVLIFGGLWGFWGVFFAIPLATLVKAVVNAWPSNETT